MVEKQPEEVPVNNGKQDSLLRILFDESRDAVIISDNQGKFTDVNNRACELFRASKAEILNLTVPQVIDPEDLKKNPIKTTEIIAGQPVSRERLVQRMDGSRFQAKVTAYRLDADTLLTVVRDITPEVAERSRNERIMDSASEGIWTLDASSRTTYVNTIMASMLGYTPEEIIGHPASDFLPAEELADHRQRLQQRRQGTPDNYQRKFKRKDGSILVCHITASALLDVNGNFDGSFALVTDITESLNLETRLNEILEFQRVMLDNINLAVILVSLEGNFIQVNNAFKQLFGYSDDDISKLTVANITAPESLSDSLEAFRSLIQGNVPIVEMEKEYFRKDGSRFWASITGTAVHDSDGKIQYLTAFIKDLTKQKQAQQELRESELRFQSLIEASPNGMFVVQDGKYVYANKSGKTLLGVQDDEVIGQPATWMIHPDDLPVLRERMQKINDGVSNKPVELRFVRPDGTQIYTESTSVPIIYRHKPAALVIGQDVSDRHTNQVELAESEERNRTILEHLSEAVFVHDHEGNLVFVNQAASDQTGYSREELLSMKVMDIDAGSVDRDDRGSVWEKLEKGHTITIEAEHRRKDGSIYPAEIRIGSMIYHGDQVVLATARDITERKKTEEILKDNETKIISIFEHLTDAVYACNLDGEILYVNQASSKQTGFSREELMHMRVIDIDAKSGERDDPNLFWKKLNNSDQIHFETLHRRKDGTLFPAEIHLAKTELKGEDIILGTVRDITERKKVEKALSDSEERFQLAMEAANEGIWDLDVVTNQVYCSPGYWKILGYDPQSTNTDNKKWEDLLHPDDRDRVMRAMADCMENRTPEYSQEFRMLCKDGSWKWIESQGKVTACDHSGRALRLLGTHTDITERKLAHEALRVSEDRLSKTLLASNDGYWDWNLQTNEVYYSDQYYQMAGYAVNEFPHQFDEFRKRVHPDDIDRVMDVADRHLRGELARFEVEFRFLRKDGSWMWIQGKGLITEKDADGTPVRFTGTHTDITDRINAARELENAYRTSNDIVNTIPSGLFIYQYTEPDQLHLILANPQANVITGITLEEWAGREFNEIWPEAKQLGITDQYLDVMRTGNTYETDDLFYADNKISGAYHILAFRLPENRLAVAFEDISEKKQAEAQLKEKTIELEQFFQNNLDLLCIADTSGRFIRLNNEWESVLGYPLSELEGASFFDFIHPEDLDATTKAVSVLNSQEVLANFINRYRCKDGSYRFIEWRSYPVGKTIYAAARDITERIKTENILSKRTQELESLFLLSKELRAAQSRDEILEISAHELHKLVKLDGLSVNLINPEGTSYKVVYADGIAAPNLGKTNTLEIPIAQTVMQSQQVVYIKDYASSPQRNADSIDTDKMGPVAIIQIRSEMGILGAFSLMRSSGAEEFSQDNLHLFTAIGEMVGNALRRSGLFEQAMTRLKQVQALHEIDMAISTSLDQNFSLQAILDRTIRLMDVDAASVLLLNPNTLQLEYKAGLGFFHPRSFEGISIRLGESIAGQVALRQVTTTVEDLPSQNEFVVTDRLIQEKFTCVHAAPMIVKGQVIGVLQAFHRDICPRDPERIDFLEALAAQAAIAVSNARMFTDLEKSNLELQLAYDATIEGWSLATDLRDKETEGHSLRVASMAVRLAELMGVTGKDIVHIRRGGLLHDIGKLAIPDSILFKPGPLTDDEWILMRQHPIHAREMLQRIPFLKRALAIPLHHHEKFDGSGYPDGLKGDQIPLAARIFTLVDVWDALSSDRPYRKAWPTSQVLDYLRQESGKHFDPQVVKAFLDNYENLIR